jgi:hypothetical protein
MTTFENDKLSNPSNLHNEFGLGEGVSETSSATRTHCEVLHQYHGSYACQTRCTLSFGHGGAHVCSNGHDF